MNTNPTQTQRVLSCLRNGGRITQLDAWQRLGVMRLAARCQELRDAGHDVRSEMIEVENRWGEKCRVASYRLEVQ